MSTVYVQDFKLRTVGQRYDHIEMQRWLLLQRFRAHDQWKATKDVHTAMQKVQDLEKQLEMQRQKADEAVRHAEIAGRASARTAQATAAFVNAAAKQTRRFKTEDLKKTPEEIEAAEKKKKKKERKMAKDQARRDATYSATFQRQICADALEAA